MQEYLLFLLQSMLLFTGDMLVYCITNYQLTYAVLVYYCILVIKKSDFIKIAFIFTLLSTEQWFFYGHSFLALVHIPLTYYIWYQHHHYLYFNTPLFMGISIGSFGLQLIAEEAMLEAIPFAYIYCKLCGIIVFIWYGMHRIRAHNNMTKKGR
ncbi:MAG TPA: hypothetical protein VL201_00750 [Patescibacteria group bacterium]|jgi:hypothetical protein|nr:hypothetical protein [Patescibacteria group bacterium]